MKSRQARGSFLKKRTKKLLLIWTALEKPPRAQLAKVFLLLFFQKKQSLLTETAFA
jgi:hypothetical protein